MGERKYTDLVIRGVTYSTAQAAAKALGVSDVTVMRAARLGILDDCGLGRSHPRPMRCRIAGQDFPTVKAAAKHYGVHVSAIYQALDDGDVDRIARPQPPCMINAKPITVGPLSWPSWAAAERDMGLPRGTIRNAQRRDSITTKQRVLSAAMALAARRMPQVVCPAVPKSKSTNTQRR